MVETNNNWLPYPQLELRLVLRLRLKLTNPLSYKHSAYSGSHQSHTISAHLLKSVNVIGLYCVTLRAKTNYLNQFSAPQRREADVLHAAGIFT